MVQPVAFNNAPIHLIRHPVVFLIHVRRALTPQSICSANIPIAYCYIVRPITLRRTQA